MGLTILQGPPGTGKTFYLRYLVHELRSIRRFYYSRDRFGTPSSSLADGPSHPDRMPAESPRRRATAIRRSTRTKNPGARDAVKGITRIQVQDKCFRNEKA